MMMNYHQSSIFLDDIEINNSDEKTWNEEINSPPDYVECNKVSEIVEVEDILLKEVIQLKDDTAQEIVELELQDVSNDELDDEIA